MTLISQGLIIILKRSELLRKLRDDHIRLGHRQTRSEDAIPVLDSELVEGTTILLRRLVDGVIGEKEIGVIELVNGLSQFGVLADGMDSVKNFHVVISHSG